MLGSTVQGDGRGRKRGEEACASGEKCETSAREECLLHWRESGDVAWSGDNEETTGGGAKRQARFTSAQSVAATRMAGGSLLVGRRVIDVSVMKTYWSLRNDTHRG